MQKADVYASVGMQQILAPLLSTPIIVYCSYCKYGVAPPLLPFIAFWFALVAMLLLFFRKHRYRIVSVTASEAGLELRSPFLLKNVRWLDIEDFFPTSTIDPWEFVLQCRDGNEFFLSRDLTDSATLFASIERRRPCASETYELNTRIPDGFFDLCKLALASSGLCLGWLVYQCLQSGIHVGGNMLANLAVMGPICALAAAWCWMHLRKTPQLIRVGPSSIHIRIGNQRQNIKWDQVTGIRNFAGLLIVNTGLGWFRYMGEKSDPLRAKLIEHNSVLVLKSHASPKFISGKL